MNLYEINTELRKIGELIEENDGELTGELDVQLTELNVVYKEKLDHILALRQEYIHQAKSLDNELERLKALAGVAKNTADRLKEYVYDSMKANDDQKLELVRFKVWLQKSPPGISECPLAEDLPDEYVRIIPEERKIDKKALIDDWKRDKPLPDGVVISAGETLRVK